MKALAVSLLLLSLNASAASYYVDFASGNDANPGTSKAQAFKRAPMMAGFTGSYTHSAGDVFVFKGGVVWTGCWPLKISAGGSSDSVRDVYTQDPTWFAGGSYSMPIFDAGGQFWAGGVTGSMVWLNAPNVTFDGFDCRNMLCINTGDDGKGLIALYGTAMDNVTITNCLVHDWFLTDAGGHILTASYSPGTLWDANGVGGIIFSGSYGANVHVSGCRLYQSGIAQRSGCALRKVSNVDHTEVFDTTNAYLGGGVVNDCHFHDLTAPTDPMSHCNAIETFAPSTIYNNLLHDFDAHVAPILLSPDWSGGYGIDLLYNNVLWNTGGQPPVRLDTSGANPSLCGLRFYNNTVDAGGPGTPVSAAFRNASYTFQLLDCRNNHLITSGTAIGANNQPAGWGAVSTVIDANNVVMTPATAAADGYNAGGLYMPPSGAAPTVAAGQNLSTWFTADRLGVPRGATWDSGAYQFSSSPGTPGIIALTVSAADVLESAGSISVTASRTYGSFGVIGCTYSSFAGSATPGVNFTTVNGNLSWGHLDIAPKTFTVPILNVPFYGSKQFTVGIGAATGGATIVAPSTQTITINGVGTPATNLLVGLSWEAEAGTLQPPMATATAGGVTYAYQPIQTFGSGQGIDSFTFTAPSTGIYQVRAKTSSIDDNSNSFYVDVDEWTPTEPTMVWDTPVTGAGTWTNSLVTWRGTGIWDSPEISPKTWSIPAGQHTLYVLGRESNTLLDSLTLELLSSPAPVAIGVISLTGANGWFKSGTTIPIHVNFSGIVNVTGTPQLHLNNGDLVNYTTGSGSTNLVFPYTVAPGHDTNSLDIASTTALTLNGGTIKDGGGLDAVLTLPEPGTAGSLSFGSTIGVDTIAPTITVGAPSLTIVTNNSQLVQIPVTYYDLNMGPVSLGVGQLSFSSTGNVHFGAASTVSASEGVIYLSGFSGSGTVRVSVVAGTGRDLALNLSPASALSAPVTVSVGTSPRILNGSIHNGRIGP